MQAFDTFNTRDMLSVSMKTTIASLYVISLIKIMFLRFGFDVGTYRFIVNVCFWVSLLLKTRMFLI